MVIQAEQLADQIGKVRDDGSVEDGLRIIYWDSRKRRALRERLKELGIRKDPEPGDWVALKWVSGVGETGDPKLYKADFRKGQPKGAGGFFTEGVVDVPVPAHLQQSHQQVQRQVRQTVPADDQPPF